MRPIRACCTRGVAVMHVRLPLLPSKVYVNGLHSAVTEGEAREGEGGRGRGETVSCVLNGHAEELRELAEPYGEVVECNVKRDNGMRGR